MKLLEGDLDAAEDKTADLQEKLHTTEQERDDLQRENAKMKRDIDTLEGELISYIVIIPKIIYQGVY